LSKTDLIELFGIMLRHGIYRSTIYGLNCRFQHSRSKSLEEIRDRLSSGPSFQDFVQNPEPAPEEWQEYDGKLKR